MPALVTAQPAPAPAPPPPPQRTAAEAAEAAEHELEPVYVWDLVVRLCHWAVVFSMLTLVVTGIDIGHPFLGGGHGKAGFTHGYVRVVHFYAAQLFTLAVGARIVWMFRGPRVSGWRTFVPASRRRQRGLVQTLLFYSALKSKPPESIAHNPMAGFTYLFVFGMYLLMIASGFALYSSGAYTSYMHRFTFLVPLFGGLQNARWIHHVTMWLLLCFVIQHVFSAILTSLAEKNGCVDSMFSGYKYLPRNRKPDDDRD
ncbi:MAG TPA: Ni/Fe-hydrogenase, b-type cytochrome subunit [Kofleriaceae bacterium]|nr:Ni/Fe-hydrogenase, b-type cytochrome subunit [Kofleriaceae bacterium]